MTVNEVNESLFYKTIIILCFRNWNLTDLTQITLLAIKIKLLSSRQIIDKDTETLFKAIEDLKQQNLSLFLKDHPLFTATTKTPTPTTRAGTDFDLPLQDARST